MASGKGATGTVSYDGATFSIRGNRVLILAGSVHYPRVHPSRWDAMFNTFREARLNTIETYVFWGEHYRPPLEPGAEPDYDFTGRRDLFGFLRAAHAAGLYVILRIGPYVCAEVSYGGFPFALRDVPGMRFRTLNKPFQDAVAQWMRRVATELHSQHLLAPAGGPVMLVQLENEYQMIAGAYGDEGARYLQWCSDLQHELNFGVPTIMCFGSAEGAVETINSFYAHELVGELRKNRPNQPAVWTECWTGWYDVWGAPHHRRPIEDLAYSVARFFAAGGGGNNYYMWMGGTNFGRTPMYLQATSYDYDAPIDEFYLPTTKSNHLSALHSVLLDHYAPLLFEVGDKAAAGDTSSLSLPAPVDLGDGAKAYTWSKNLVFICNDHKTQASAELTLPAVGYRIASVPPCSVRIVDPESQVVLYDTSIIDPQHVVSRERQLAQLRGRSSVLTQWTSRTEPLPIDHEKSGHTGSLVSDPPRRFEVGDPPPEQLRVTSDLSDYCFYSATYMWASADARASALERGVVLSMEACDFVYIYINGAFCGMSQEPLWEDRKNNTWNKQSGMPGFLHKIQCDIPRDALSTSDEFTITLLSCSLGLVKGDWQLGDGASANMLEEKKGILSEVSIICPESKREGFDPSCENAEAASRKSQWTAVAGLYGEVSRWATDGFQSHSFGDAKLDSLCASEKWRGTGHPVWHEIVVEPLEVKTSWVLDLGGMSKGLLWVNGVLLGRYWNVAGTRPRNGFLDDAPIIQDEQGPATQRYYHVPPWVASSEEGKANLRITLFDERGVDPSEAKVSLLYVK